MKTISPKKIENIKFIYHEIDVFSKVNAEDFVLRFYQNLNHEVFYSGTIFKRQVGIPDLYVKDENYFIEVKTNGDGLRAEQLKWILENKDKEVVVFFLKQNIKEDKLKRIHSKRLKEEKEHNERLILMDKALKIID